MIHNRKAIERDVLLSFLLKDYNLHSYEYFITSKIGELFMRK